MHNELHQFLRSRRSIRRFKPLAIDDAVIHRIIETAGYAVSAHNRQPWRFAVVKEQAIKKRLSEQLASEFRKDLSADQISESEIEDRISRSRNRIQNAPVIIVLCMDTSEMDVYPDETRASAERTMAIQSVAAAGCMLQLAAHAEGLGSVWTCGPLFAPLVVQDALQLPAGWWPQAMFFLGFADELPKTKNLKPVEDITIFLK